MKTYPEGHVYIIENNFDSRIYIGSTVFPIEHRFKQHIRSASKNTDCLFHLYMKEHGPENFFISCLHTEYNVTLHRLQTIEKSFIQDFGDLNTVHNRMEVVKKIKDTVKKPATIFEFKPPEMNLDLILSKTKDFNRVLSISEIKDLIFVEDTNIGKIMNDLCSSPEIALSSNTITWLGYDNVQQKNNKAYFVKLLKTFNIKFKQIKSTDQEFSKFPELVEEAKIFNKNILSKKQWVVMSSTDFKQIVMMLRTSRADDIRNYYLSIDELFRIYPQYVNSVEFAKHKA
ncbi:040L [Cherax quadricarinatus iridovirus]|uniref:GIY-YIG domain-containing protein n=1 Tax=Shrimp hemocyte iridescent virus TaxID=2039780 RepID=A0A291B0W3_9VIRU|nr:040L [Cherax quadricarinatus iridovirus]YP_010084864.1 hypothetical protein KM509_gp112 [Shrimp hemocyte iridescent virus]UPA43358.1 hypothetical protein 4TH000084 [Iridovirus CN01]ASZ85020.1 040L [Cherax quadricarinatus iridovirus]ATE87121.1 hypothetical protein [Shrimp hemocyte iridescent virus]UPA43434.1 hypothetical protein 3TG000001 [Iridovirus CN01]UPA43628.1 hypothetical protein 1DG000036 [Iridovirus CN01]